MYQMKDIMGDTFDCDSLEELRAFMKGIEHAMYAYAHWQDGSMYVGTTGTTLKAAKAQLRQKYLEGVGHEYEES